MEHTHVVDGLRTPVEVVYDRWGVPHVRAHSADDAFVAQGFTAARDRLFQLDLWRRRGLGLLSEVLGERYLERDRAARLFLYRGGMDVEWAAYGEGVREAAEHFTAGINAYVELTEREPALPGVSIGHNGHVAFGLTIFPIDQEDLYVYELHPDDPGRYRYRDGWRSLDKVTGPPAPAHPVRALVPPPSAPGAAA